MYTVVDVTPDTPEWEEERRHSIGASEVGAAIGESHFGNTPFGLYLDKIGKGKRFDPLSSIIGHGAEPIIVELLRHLHPHLGEIEPGFMARSVEYPWLHASFDRILVEPSGSRVPLQLKSASAFTRQDWVEGPIADYVAQEDAECLIYGSPYAILAVWFIGSHELQVYKLMARADRQAVIVDRTRTLWYDHIVPRVVPAYTVGDDLEAIYPGVIGSVKRADPEALEAVEALRETAAIRRAAVAEWEATEGDMKFLIERFLEDATELVNPYTNNLIHTWRPDKNGNRRHFSPKTEDFKAA